MTPDLAAMVKRLKELAAKATPGPWENSRGFVRTSQNGGIGGHTLQGEGFSVQTSCQWIAECRDGEAFYNPEGNANYIAAANPQAITEVLAELERVTGELASERADKKAVEAELEATRKSMEAFRSDWRKAEDDWAREKLRADDLEQRFSVAQNRCLDGLCFRQGGRVRHD